MKLNVYKNQNEVEKTFDTDGYDLMYDTVEDILGILDGLDESTDNAGFLDVVKQNRRKLDDLILDVFPKMKKEDLRKIKLKELVPFFVDLFSYVKKSFGINEKN